MSFPAGQFCVLTVEVRIRFTCVTDGAESPTGTHVQERILAKPETSGEDGSRAKCVGLTSTARSFQRTRVTWDVTQGDTHQ